jgi:hypothetical protein
MFGRCHRRLQDRAGEPALLAPGCRRYLLAPLLGKKRHRNYYKRSSSSEEYVYPSSTLDHVHEARASSWQLPYNVTLPYGLTV